MKIAINASFIRKPDSGTGQISFNFIKKLAKKNLSGFKFILYLEEDTDLDLPANFEQRVLTNRFYKRDDLLRKIWWEKFLLPRAVRKDGCQALLSLYQSVTVLNKVPHLMLVHDTVWKIFPQYLNNWRKKAYYFLVDGAISRASHILTISENSKADIVKYFQVEKEKIKIVKEDCDEIYKKFVPKGSVFNVLNNYGIDQRQDFIFYVGGFDVRKNVPLLIDAYGKLFNLLPAEKVPDLVLAGKFNANLIPLVDNIPERIERAIKKYNFSIDKIKLIGFVEQLHLPAIFSSARLFCYPSLYEGFGLPPLEAQNSACPVITADNSSLGEYFASSAELFEDNNADDLALKMKKVLQDEALAEKIKQRGLENAKKFSWDSFTDDIIYQIKSVLK